MSKASIHQGLFTIRRIETMEEGYRAWFFLDPATSQLLNGVGFSSTVITGAVFTDTVAPIICECGLHRADVHDMEITGIMVSPRKGARLIPKPEHCRRIAQIAYDEGHRLTHIQNSKYEPVTQADVVVLHEDGRVVAYWLKQVTKVVDVPRTHKSKKSKKH